TAPGAHRGAPVLLQDVFGLCVQHGMAQVERSAMIPPLAAGEIELLTVHHHARAERERRRDQLPTHMPVGVYIEKFVLRVRSVGLFTVVHAGYEQIAL